MKHRPIFTYLGRDYHSDATQLISGELPQFYSEQNTAVRHHMAVKNYQSLKNTAALRAVHTLQNMLQNK